MKKLEIRKKILKLRRENYSYKSKIDIKLIMKILKKEKINNTTIGGYYPYNFEVDDIEILEKLEKKNFKICLPKIKMNHQMDFFKWSSKDPLIINKIGIPEPVSKDLKYPDILLVPLVAFDKNLNRVGYGGGFYDRYIKKIKSFKEIITIGMAFSFQRVDRIFIDKNDIKLDFILTEKKIF